MGTFLNIWKEVHSFQIYVPKSGILMTLELMSGDRHLLSQGETYMGPRVCVCVCDLWALILDSKCEVGYRARHRSDFVAHTESYQIHTG